MATLSLAKAKKLHPLASIVLAQLGGGKDAIESARDAAEHGADGGFGGFTNYSDTVSFYEDNKADILESLRNDADNQGVTTSEVLASFRVLKGIPDPMGVLAIGDSDEDYETVANALAWYALEEVGHAITNHEE